MLERTWDSFDAKRWREGSERMWPTRRSETVQEVELLQATEREIHYATGWNTSTTVIGHLLDGLRAARRAS
jgi:hypothetical protein